MRVLRRDQHVRVVVALLCALGVLGAWPGQASAAQSGPAVLSDAPGPQRFARTDGQYVVWQDNVDITQSHIYGARLADRQVFPIEIGPTDAYRPAVDAGVSVWVESNSATGGDIRGRQLPDGAIFDVAATAADEQYPALSGNWAAWTSYDPTTSTTTVLARDITTMSAPVVVAQALPGSEHIWDVRLSGTHVVWWEGYFQDVSWTWWIRTADIGSEPRTVREGFYVLPSFDVAGDTLVFSDNQTIVAYDLNTDQERVIANGDPPTWQQVVFPTTDGRYVFYELDWNSASGDYRYELDGYDLLTNSNFVVLSDAGGTTYPDAAGGALTWQQGADDVSDIYATPIATLLPSAAQTGPSAPDPYTRWFPETGHDLTYDFRDYWIVNGGLPTFGYPLTQEFTQRNLDGVYTVQYLERQRFELHPELAGTPYEVELGRLGAESLETQGRDWTSFPSTDPSAAHYMSQTGHAIAPDFWEYWSSHGLELGDAGVSLRESLALFGYPLSEPLTETNADGDTVLTQYFERAVFEYHPENAGTPYAVLLRRLGAEALTARGW